MLVIITSVILTIIYTFFIAFVQKKIIQVAAKKQWSFEWGLFISSIFIGCISVGVFQLHLPFFMFNCFLKAGIILSVFVSDISYSIAT